jgi:hypothetical protein
MSIGIDTVATIDRDYARLALAAARLEELRIEVDQLAGASEAVRARLAFDAEPADFVRAIIETAAIFATPVGPSHA